jgi:putative transposase
MIAREAKSGQISALCRAVNLSRSTFYRQWHLDERVDRDMALRDQVQRIALEWPAYGYRRIAAQLQREGFTVNHKRVLRLMRQDNLLCLRKRRFVRTTDSNHDWPVYPNRVPELKLTGVNQLWIADLTYIRLQYDFIYLAVILDAFSRRCIGWELDRHLDARLTVAALHQALASRAIGPMLVHHSDRGVQYASQTYVQVLKDHGIQISMSRRGNPYDNAHVESFMKTLKCEEVYLNEYETLSEAKVCIDHFLNAMYNEKRLHSALGYLPPVEFEQALSHTTLP